MSESLYCNYSPVILYNFYLLFLYIPHAFKLIMTIPSFCYDNLTTPHSTATQLTVKDYNLQHITSFYSAKENLKNLSNVECFEET